MKSVRYSQALIISRVVIVIVAMYAEASLGADVSPFVATVSPISYQGQSLSYDSNYSETDEVFYDLHNSWAAPGVLIYDNGSDVLVYAWVPSKSAPGIIYEGTNPDDATDALTASGFTVGSAGSASASSSTTSLGPLDAGNLRGAYQVALWIFGAVLMLPIILKVRPA